MEPWIIAYYEVMNNNGIKSQMQTWCGWFQLSDGESPHMQHQHQNSQHHEKIEMPRSHLGIWHLEKVSNEGKWQFLPYDQDAPIKQKFRDVSCFNVLTFEIPLHQRIWIKVKLIRIYMVCGHNISLNHTVYKKSYFFLIMVYYAENVPLILYM